MRLEKYKLNLEAESTEGIADFVPLLEKAIENIKGGFEVWNEMDAEKRIHFHISTEWK